MLTDENPVSVSSLFCNLSLKVWQQKMMDKAIKNIYHFVKLCKDMLKLGKNDNPQANEQTEAVLPSKFV